ncbi:class E sortase [Canibacter zhuwentaonis]|uniref:class E sortase n=1 Tax=Canibacter zhuwentaonis TaxID=2837491 RepID=UPI00350F0DAC
MSPLAFVIGIVSGYSGFYETLRAALQSIGKSLATQNYIVLAIIFDAPLVLLMVSSVAGIVMTGRGRELDFKELQLHGASSTGITATAFFEALIYAVTATIVGLCAGAFASLTSWWIMLGKVPDAVIRFDPEPVICVAAGGKFVRYYRSDPANTCLHVKTHLAHTQYLLLEYVAMTSKRARLSPVTVIGELLLVSGLAVFGFMLWQPWYTTTVVAKEQSAAAREVAAEWQKKTLSAPAVPAAENTVIPVARPGGYGEPFGVLYVPAFGENWANKVSSGEPMLPLLNDRNNGVAHYSETNLPGEYGNFALAAHRSGGRATPFKDIDFLRVGDSVYFETEDGWYTYKFRNFEYVLPAEVDTLNPFPHFEGTPGQDSILTFTTCNPKYYGINERMVAYSVFDSFTPRADGPPADMIRDVPALQEQASSARTTDSAPAHLGLLALTAIAGIIGGK